MSENGMDGHQVEENRAGKEAAPERPVRPARRGRVAAAAGAVLLAAAVVAGAGYTVVTVQDADRDPGAPRWALPREKTAGTKPAAQTGLAGMLAPYDTLWERGPDLGEYGSDARLSGQRATALRKEAYRDLPRTRRKRLEQEIDRERIQGMAMRSYVQAAGDIFQKDTAVTVSIVLTQMKDRAAVRSMVTFQNAFLTALDVFREGPEIKGHKNAGCFLSPTGEDSDVQGGDGDKGIEGMVCSAYEGNVLVSVTATGPRSLNTKQVAALLTEQLDRIEEPGKAV
ncbi:hypothetical protein [Streptomyces sp. NPDC018610]|uniref:hypothetical protein n=1 Tax=Streptomyces sp. NPDC018610 TaxID=3365049 RepID=UPI00378852F2